MDTHQFFLIETPQYLKELQPDSPAKWGSMNAPEMLDHLRRGIDLSLVKDLRVVIVTPEEELPAYKTFLMSDRSFKKSSPRPQEYELMPPFEGEWEELKVNLMKSIVHLLSYFDNHPEHTAAHPNFGVLNTTEWLQLHYKHFIHHFKQFGLIPE